jgi:UPF0042 nucleotide-binding protein
MIKNFIIITGISGAGKSQALKTLEDLSFYCADNIPPELIEDFLNLYSNKKQKYTDIAINVGPRAATDAGFINNIARRLKAKKINYKILFFDAADAVLIRRYSESRRRHPMGKTVTEGINLERKLFEPLRLIADAVVDTSTMSLAELRTYLSGLAGVKTSKSDIAVSVYSFGFKYGMPVDADIVFDMRFLKNPNYVAALKEKTGLDAAVKKYVTSQKIFKTFFNMFSKTIISVMPHYINEGKNYLTIAIGCTGGRHRSVATACELAKVIGDKGYKVKLDHRDVLRKR